MFRTCTSCFVHTPKEGKKEKTRSKIKNPEKCNGRFSALYFTYPAVLQAESHEPFPLCLNGKEQHLFMCKNWKYGQHCLKRKSWYLFSSPYYIIGLLIKWPSQFKLFLGIALRYFLTLYCHIFSLCQYAKAKKKKESSLPSVFFRTFHHRKRKRPWQSYYTTDQMSQSLMLCFNKL